MTGVFAQEVLNLAGLITHYICGQAAIDALEFTRPGLAAALRRNRQLFNVGAQGPDVFFYYLPCLYRRGLQGLGQRMHNGGVSDFFAAFLKLMGELPEDRRAGAFAYLAGYITHYALDCATHPYIYYKTGFRRKGEKRPRLKKLRCSVNHRRFETNIDVLMLKATSSERPADKKLWQLLRVPYKTASATADVLSRAISEVYHVRLNSRQVYAAMYEMAAANRIIQSRRGRRKRVMELIEGATVREHVISSLIHSQEVADGIDYLNLAHTDWNLPWDGGSPINKDFIELYAGAVESAADMIGAVGAYFGGKLELPALLAILGNNSFSTGEDAAEPREFIYSDVVYKRA